MENLIRKVYVVNVGNEVLSGKVLNVNLAFIGKRLSPLGIEINKSFVIPDDSESISDILKEVWKPGALVIFTGGLGPTPDDITKKSIADFFKRKLVFNEEIFNIIKKMFEKRNIKMADSNRVQAFIPEDFTILNNSYGTAPALFFKENDRSLFCLPGVPFEMKKLFEEFVINEVVKSGYTKEYFCKDINTFGISESKLADIMKDLHQAENVSIAWLPHTGRVDVRIYGHNVIEAEKLYSTLRKELSEFVWGIDKESPLDVLHDLLIDKSLTISTAESCTGGLIASFLTSNPGSSSYFKGAVIAYSNEIKVNILNVDKKIIEEYGAVSYETAESMLFGCYNVFLTDLVCSVTGIAGPDGGTDDKPVGTVYIGVLFKGKSCIEKCFFTGSRDVIRHKVYEKALFMILKLIGG